MWLFRHDHLPEEIVAEILVRLPARSVVRCRSVSRAFRRITTDPRFLADHARRRPPEILLYTYLPVRPCDFRPANYSVDIALDALPVASSSADGQLRRIMRYPRFVTAGAPQGTGRWVPSMRMHCLLLASCDGVLLFKMDDVGGVYVICNPVTGQWTKLPRPPLRYCTYDRGVESTFYLHRPSGEFRLLCRLDTGARLTYFVLSTGAAAPRHIDVTGEVRDPLYSIRCLHDTPVSLHGRLHWRPRSVSYPGERKMAVFDTVSETFHRAALPATRSCYVKLFAMDGLLAAAEFLVEGRRSHVDLWFLVDYGAGRWERRHRVAEPWEAQDHHPLDMVSVAAAANDDEGEVILGDTHGLVVYSVRKKKTVRTLASLSGKPTIVSRHAFRESLVQHGCFRAQPSPELPFIQFS